MSALARNYGETGEERESAVWIWGSAALPQIQTAVASKEEEEAGLDDGLGALDRNSRDGNDVRLQTGGRSVSRSTCGDTHRGEARDPAVDG